MKKNMKKAVSLAVALSMVASLAGCADKAGEEVLEAADTYAKAITDLDADKIVDLSSDFKDDDAEVLSQLLGYEMIVGDEKPVIEAIADTLSYEIDEESVEASTKDGEGEVEVTFTYADYEAVMEDEANMTDADTLAAAIKAADETVEKSVKLEFELEDEEWLVTNYDDVLEVYDFFMIMPEFPTNLADAITGTSWWLADDSTTGYYENTDSIELDLSYDYSADISEVYYTVEFGGEVIYTGSDDYGWGQYGYYQDAELTADGYLPEGEYTITFYDGNDNVLASETATVAITAGSSTADPVDDPVADPSTDEEIFFDDVNCVSYYNQEFFDSISITSDNKLEAGWWDYGYTDDAGNTYQNCMDGVCYTTNADTIAFSVKLSDSATYNGSITYSYYFCDEDGTMTDEVFTNTITPTTYTDGTYYDFDYSIGYGNAVPGSYIIAAYDAVTNDILFMGLVPVA
ncbi:MAG: hypothetical protein II718_01885 [Clostridiales bacterium]|nr:hypothetical protein [Clostridiales bacterium]